MRVARALPLVLVSTALFLVAGAAARQDDAPPRDLWDFTQEEQMQMQMQMLQLAAPGPQHELLAKYAGSFDVEVKVWMAPGAEPMTVGGTAENEMVLDGRFLQSKGESTFMDMPMSSLVMWGYDRRNETVTMVGFDTLGTYYVTAAGPFDEGSRTARLAGEDVDRKLNVVQKFDFVLELVDDDTMKQSLIFKNLTKDGPFKLMESVYRRRKEGAEK